MYYLGLIMGPASTAFAILSTSTRPDFACTHPFLTMDNPDLYTSYAQNNSQQDVETNWPPTIATGGQFDVGTTSTQVTAFTHPPYPDHTMTDTGDTGRQNPSDYYIDRTSSLQTPQLPRRAVHPIGQDINHYLTKPATAAIQLVLSDYDNWLRTQDPDLTLLCHFCKDFARYSLFQGVSGGNPKWIEHNFIETVFRSGSDIRAWWEAEKGTFFPHHSISK